MDRQQDLKSQQRLEYLLKKSDIFAKLKMGKTKSELEADAQKGGGTRSQKKANGSNGRRSSKSRHRHGDEIGNPDEDGEDDDEEEAHTFLTKQPNCIEFGTLKPYQLEGLNWMIHLQEKGINGILADEMGLGKTLQSISVLAYNLEYLNLQGPHLIAVPKSTLSNWMNELKRWCPSLRAIRFHGSREERAELIAKYFTNKAACHDGRRPTKKVEDPETKKMVDDNSDNPRLWDVCVTTYEVINTEKKVLSKFAWKYMVIDEAHRLKNEASIFSKTVRELRTAHRLLLTGTPLQNNLHELWALLNFLLPDIFSSSEQFDEWFNLDVDDDDAKKNMIETLHKILRPFMIRRLKADVAKGLPPKTETLVMVGMSKLQKQLYKKLLLRDIDSVTGNSSQQGKTAILNIVMQLRKCCAHPYLFEGVEDRTLDPLGSHLVENCGKLCLVDKLLVKLKQRGSRVLIFTQMTRVLDILEDYMVMRGHQYCRIDGNTEYEVRESSIAEYNRPGSDKFCFLLSTRAGGLGINLQTADTCILYDSDWNPQADLQAQDRCHRLGQTRPVNVYRLVTENTIEEKIVERAQQKLKLDAMVVQQGRLKEKDSKVSKEEIMAAIRFGADAVFRSDESTITDEDIDVILERSKAKTKELQEKIQKAEKGDLLDFRLDTGFSAQTFEGVDYSDKDLRAQLRLLAADSMGKRERKPVAINYSHHIAPKKSMMVNNRKIKLPRSLRLPRMEVHQFYDRERLEVLGKLEFQTYAVLKQKEQLPPREYIDRARTLLPPELAEEKLRLLDAGFQNWTRSQYFHFVKATAKYGRDDLESISADLELPVELVTAYSRAFWKNGESLQTGEWERVKGTIEKGEAKIAKRKLLSNLLKKFLQTFDDPRREMTFANKGTQHFMLELDRALLCSVDKHGYGNWEAVRDELRNDRMLQFNHSVLGMTCDSISKRCEYRMRQMEKELDAREKKVKYQSSVGVMGSQRLAKVWHEVIEYERQALENEARGVVFPPTDKLSEQARGIWKDRQKERQSWIDRLREIHSHCRGAKALADITRKQIRDNAQYVNYSNITLKEGGRALAQNPGALDLEARINAKILRVPACGECEACRNAVRKTGQSHSIVNKLCEKRMEVRSDLIAQEAPLVLSNIDDITNCYAADGDTNMNGSYDDDSQKGEKKRYFGENRGNPLGNKRMAVPDELLPELCSLITAFGTNRRNHIINDFARSHPSSSNRQVTKKFAELSTKIRPSCVPEPAVKGGRAIMFYLRPRFYKLLNQADRPENWKQAAEEDEILWRKEQREIKDALTKTNIVSSIEDVASKSQTSEVTAEIADGDETEED
eukprot:CAMPEP_0113309202 /NCGR_PEP_ID=MMETSP0010_2-20120614/7346_1 /TAXON_ID=216773 ORGANISM="Corethron hystrix, Strain 308" /NCGR_SAMPLE_ID=MMETSP0010_2 /ASSEMBLY_ACC=CAM_ASM_000155 /LENGTH=1329 /DNA_ID=CAMNT_0000164419 /DNA_START=73 /DNA_END=4062 /DNA_ORIENTATION=+ /assembly_acc=CAM_ASM_000155